MAKIINYLYQTGERLGFFFYTKPQQYQVRYQVFLFNRLKKQNKVSIVLPIPKDAHYQKLKHQPKFSPQPQEIDNDSQYKNKYAVWHLTLKPGQSKKIEEVFSISVRPQKYKFQQKFTLDDYVKDKNYLLYTQANALVQPFDKRIQQLVQKNIGNQKDLETILKSLNNYVLKNLKYGKPIWGLYSSTDALEKKLVDCGGFNTLLAALCIAAGLPARIVTGFWAGYQQNKMHAWLEILLPNGQWIPADPSIQQLKQKGRTKRSAKLGFIGSDRITLSNGCDLLIKIKGRIHQIDILQNPFVIAEGGKDSIEVKVDFKTAKDK